MKTSSVTVEQMREVDRMMIDEIGVSITMMMEHAGRHVANVARKMLNEDLKGKRVVIIVHKGNNGGDGLAAARHVTNYGGEVICYLTANPSLVSPESKAQLNILEKSGIQVKGFQEDHLKTDLANCNLIIDALLGYNLKGDPKEPLATSINLANQSKKPILAVDIPSGMNGDDGGASDPTIKAEATVTLALPKAGLLKPDAKEYVGELYVGDLSVPKQIYDKLGIEAPLIYRKEELVKI